MLLARLKTSACTVPAGLTLTRTWRGSFCRATLHNPTPAPITVPEIVLFDLAHGFSGDTPLYGEAFQMLSQLAGTLANPADVGYYPDRTHYKIPEPESLRTSYGMLMLTPENQERVLLGFTSCKRFIGRFSFDTSRLRISLDTENRTIAPGECWELEEFLMATGNDREALLDKLTSAIAKHHPKLKHSPVPTGWCSWYCFGPEVTDKNIYDNLEWAVRNLPSLRYIQIDDGYQPHMGDWLDTGKAFGGSVQTVLKAIAQKDFEPALWVAPFIADGQSRLFAQHPDWFVKDETGAPLPSNKIGFGGWRMGPWYCLDGSHPAVQEHLEALFRTLHQDWGVTYFKLDANYWGAIHGGHHFDKNTTRIEAYRRGMEAILRGVGPNSVILGCNHPIWPSLGLIHASRSSNDIDRSWESFTKTGRENLYRGWQNGRFWWNDPDCLLLTGDLSDSEFLFHATLLYATGGMLLSGDDLTQLSPKRLAMLQKMLPATGICARFADENFTVGEIKLRGKTHWALFNGEDSPATRLIPLAKPAHLTDVWSDGDLGVHSGNYAVELPARSARLIESSPHSHRS
jgi:alpha-galactosidase